MTPPPIRYPLPCLAALILLALVGWRGADVIAAARRSIVEGWQARFDPPPPKSTEPARSGPLVAHVLLLREDVEARDEPDGAPVETIRRRGYFDVYDAWPLKGEPTHLRIGNRRPIGWVDARDVLRWDTRLVLADSHSMRPIVSWAPGILEAARWREGEPWSAVDGIESVEIERLDPGAWAAWMSRDELLALLAECVAAEAVGGLDVEARQILRARAVAGRILTTDRMEIDEARAILAYLPREMPVAADGATRPSERLARLNENWKADAAWSGLTFRAVPLSSLP